MTRVEIDRTSDEVRKFLMTLNDEESVVILTLHGQPVLRVIQERLVSGVGSDDWTDEKNNRRCQLINKKYDTGVSAEEQKELDHLQMQLYRHREQELPLPYEFADRLFRELERKSAKLANT